MSAPITLRLLWGGAPIWRSIGMAFATFGVLILVDRARHWTMPIADPSLHAMARQGAIVFLAAALLGAILSAAVWEVRVCPFGWNLPGLLRRAARETRIAGVIVIMIAAAIGAVLHGAAGHAPPSADGSSLNWLSGIWLSGIWLSGIWFPGTAAALGFGLGVFNLDPPPAWNRPWQLPPNVAAIVPVYFMAEIAWFAGRQPLLCFAGAVAIMFAMIEFNGAGSARRARHRLDRSAWPADSVTDVSGIHGVSSSRRAPRDGADAFSGVRRSDESWVRAFLHETCGGTRGGLVGQSLELALACLLTAALVSVYFSIDGSSGVDPTPSFADRLAETPRGAAVWAVLFPILVVMSMFTLGSPNLPVLTVTHPLSRARRARIVWLMTLAQEALILLALLGMIGVATVLLAMFTTRDPWPHAILWASAATAVCAVLPLGRWARLELLEARCHDSGTGPPSVNSPHFVLASCVNAVAIVGGAVLLFAVWRTSRDLPDSGRILVVIASLAGIAALRWLWLAVLVRFHARRDLPPS